MTKYIDLKTHVHVFKIAADEFVATFYWIYTIVRLSAYYVSGFQKKKLITLDLVDYLTTVCN